MGYNVGKVQTTAQRREEIRADIKQIKRRQDKTRDLEAWMSLQNIIRVLNYELKPKVSKKNHADLND